MASLGIRDTDDSQLFDLLDRDIKDAIETLNKGRRVFKRHAFHEQRLIEEQPCGILRHVVIGACQQLLHDLVIRIDLQRRLERRNVLLPHGAQHLLHFQRGLFFVGDDAGRAVGQPHRSAHILHPVAQRRLDLLEQRLQLVRFVRLRLVFQIFAGGRLVDRLQFDIAVLVDAGEDDLVDLVVEDQHFEILLLVDLEQRRRAQQGFGAAGDVVDALLAFLHARLHFGKAGEPLHFGGLEADQIEQRFAIGEVAVQALLERPVVFGDELQILLGLAGRDVLQLGQDLLDAGGSDAGEDRDSAAGFRG